MPNEQVFFVRRARFTPAILIALVIVLSVTGSPWWLISIPFIVIGTLFSAPNMNLIDGSLSYVSMLVGFILLPFHFSSGLAILVGTTASFCGSAFEMYLFAVLYQAQKTSQNHQDDLHFEKK